MLADDHVSNAVQGQGCTDNSIRNAKFGMNGVKQVVMSKEISKQFFIRKRLVSKMGICEKEVQKEAKG